MTSRPDRDDGTRGERRRVYAVLAAAFAAAVVALTLVPGPPPDPTPFGLEAGDGPLLCLICGHFGAADFLRNLAFFVPLGLLVHLAAGRRRGLALALLAGLFLSAAVEAGQLLVPGRYSTLGDLVANAAGAGLGGLAVRWRRGLLRPPARLSGRLSLAAGAAAGAAFLLTGRALSPSPTGERNWVQWTPDLGQYEAYRGEVLTARLAGRDVAPGRMDARGSALARRAIRRGSPVSATVRLGPPPQGVAPVLSLFDDRQRENLLLGVDGDDLVLRVRYRAEELRLSRPALRFRDALAGRAPGDTVRLAAWRPRRGETAGDAPAPPTPGDGGEVGAATGPRDEAYCLSVDDVSRCGFAFPPGRGWSLLAHPEGLDAAAVRALDGLWVGLLLFPLGFWGVRRWTAGLGVVLAAGGFAAAPMLTPLVAPGAAGILGTLAGAGAGLLVRRRAGSGPDGAPRTGTDASA